MDMLCRRKTRAPEQVANLPRCTNHAASGAQSSTHLGEAGIHAWLCQFGGGVVRRHNAVVRTLATLIHQITGAAVHVERRTEELRRIFRGRLQEGQMDLVVADFGGSTVYIDVTIVSPVLADPHHLAQAAKTPAYAALRAEFGKRKRYPVPNMIPFALELGGRPGPSAQRFIRELFRVEGAGRDQGIADAWSAISSALQGATARQLNKTGHCQ